MRLTKSDMILLVFTTFAVMVSGAAGLAYEVVWTRMLVVPLGNSADATAMVLAAFMLGIALGARLLGGLADRIEAPLKLYALLEILLGLYAFAMPFLIDLLGNLDVLKGNLSDKPLAAIGRLFSAGVIVALPSLAMGATIPVLVRALTNEEGDVRRRIGLVYGANTVGAALGAVLAGFVGAPRIGLTATSVIAALGSFTAAVVVFAAFRFTKRGEGRAKGVNPKRASAVAPSRPSKAVAWIALTAAVASGTTMLAAEVLWSRLLTFVFGHDTYTFAALLAIVLLGLGVGGFLYKKVSHLDPIAVCAALVGLLGLSLLASYWVAAWLVVALGRDPFGLAAIGSLSGSLELELYREIIYTSVLVLIPSVLAGATFPAACALYAGNVEDAGRRVGTAALFNGVGCAFGSLITSFLLIGWIGIQGSFLVAGGFVSFTSLIIILSRSGSTPKRATLMLSAPAVLAILLALLVPASLPKAMLKEAVGSNHQDLLFYEEGRVGTVSVTSNTVNREKQLFMNAVNEVTTRLVHDQSFKLLGHLGPLLHPRPKNGAMVCLGAGLSAGAALVHPFAELEVVELSSTMPRAAALWTEENNDVLSDPRLSLHIADGRHFLLSSSKRYDVIMVDSTHPKAVDSWILYTREFYELLRDRLKEDGIAVQWVPLHGLSEREFKIIVRTFFDVFPETTLWVNVGYEVYGQAAYVKMVASAKPLLIDVREVGRRLREPRIERDLAPFGMASIEELLDCFLAGPQAIASWTEGLPVQTDDRPIVPYTTQFSSGRRMSAPLLLSVRSSVLPFLRRMGVEETAFRDKLAKAHDAQGFLLAGMLERAAETWPDGQKIKLYKKRASLGRSYYLALAEKYEGDADKTFEIASYLGNLGYPEDAKMLYERAQKKHPGDPRFTINLALVLLDLEQVSAAADLLGNLVKQDPNNGLALYNLGVAKIASGDPAEAVRYLRMAIELLPDLIGARLSLANALIALDKLDGAEVELGAIIEKNRWVAEAWDMLGLVAARRRDWSVAKKLHIKALALEPYRASFHYNLGIALQESGQLKEAAAAYQAALKIEPKDAEAENNLGLVYSAAGLAEQAAAAHQRALLIEPQYPEAAYNLGLDYRALNRNQEAIDAFGIALELDPNLEPAREQLREMGVQKTD